MGVRVVVRRAGGRTGHATLNLPRHSPSRSFSARDRATPRTGVVRHIRPPLPQKSSTPGQTGQVTAPRHPPPLAGPPVFPLGKTRDRHTPSKPANVASTSPARVARARRLVLRRLRLGAGSGPPTTETPGLAPRRKRDWRPGRAGQPGPASRTGASVPPRLPTHASRTRTDAAGLRTALPSTARAPPSPRRCSRG